MTRPSRSPCTRLPHSVAHTRLALASALTAVVACSGEIGGTAAGGPPGGTAAPGGAAPGSATSGGATPGGGPAVPGASGGTAGPGTTGPVPTPSPAACQGARPAGPRRIVRLTPVQVRRTVSVLFNGRASIKGGLFRLPAGVDTPLQPTDDDRFSTYAGSHTLSDIELRSGIGQTGGIARALVAQLRATKSECLGATPRPAVDVCAATVAASKGEILFRRPLDPAEVDHYRGLVAANAGALGEDAAYALMFQAMLLAPQTLFRTELGTATPAAGQVTSLTPFEVAAALSYAFLDAPPDDELWTAAKSGALATPAQIAAQVARLAGALDKNDGVQRFLVEHFTYDQVQTVFKTVPGYDPALLYDEVKRFVADTLATNGRKDFLRTLLTSRTAFVSHTTFALYGAADPGANMVGRVQLPTTDRAGLLTQPAFLAAYSDMDTNEPVQRGRFISTNLLCRPVPPVPIAMVPPLPPTTADTPMRDRLAVHRKDPGCAVCHTLMDPMGLAFEAYDDTGKVRTTKVDTSGMLTGAGTADGPFANAVELSQRLASSPVVEGCFVLNSLRYWLGRDERDADGCAIAGAQAAYGAGGDYLALLQNLFTSSVFLDRKAE